MVEYDLTIDFFKEITKNHKLISYVAVVVDINVDVKKL
jgi:hypothetical protein